MKNIILALGIFALFAFPSQARAENTYGFVNMVRVVQDCDAGKALRKELEVKGQQFQAELSSENKKLSQERQAFEQKRGTMSKEDADTQMRALESKYATADKMLRDRREQWSRAVAASSAELKQAAVDIILALSKERNYAAVFSQESVILAASEYDITDEVIKRLNDKVKKVAVDWTASQGKKK
jgi:Skp family chaperone for outer membrane proteins